MSEVCFARERSTFSSNGRFAYSKVSGQEKWEEMKQIAQYRNNIYSLGKDNQIYKHTAKGTDFSAKKAYLKPETQKELGTILDVSIDGGFYLVKQDLSFVKFFSNPYRVEKLEVRNTPKNFKLKDPKHFSVKSRMNLNYVYLLMNNTIWVFKTDSNNYSTVTALTYIGQIEWAKSKIIDFYPITDTNLLVLNENGVYNLNFEVSDNALMLK